MLAFAKTNKPKTTRQFIIRLGVLVFLVNFFIVAILAMATRQSYYYFNSRAQVLVQNLSQVLERNLSNQIDRIDTSLIAVIDEIDIRHGLATLSHDDAQKLLQRHFQRTPGILGLRLTDANGNVLYAEGRGSGQIQNVSDRDFFQKLKTETVEDDLFISAPFLGRTTPEWMVVFARKLPLNNGAFTGIAFAAVQLSEFTRSFSVLELGPHGAVALRDSSLSVIARHPDVTHSGTIAAGQKAVSSELQDMIQKFPNRGTYRAKAGIDKIERILSYQKIGGRPLYIVVGLSVEDTLVEWRKNLYRNALLVAFFFPMTLVAAWWFYRSWQAQQLSAQAAYIASAHLQAILGNAPIGIIIVDDNRVVKQANEQMAAIFALNESDQLINNTTLSFYATTDAYQALGDRAYPIIRRKETFQDVIPMSRADGRLFWCKLTGRFVDFDHPDLGTVWVIEDVTEQKNAEEEVRASEERFRIMIDGIRDYAIILLGPTGTVVTWNHGAEAIKGYRSEDIIGKSFSLFYRQEDREDSLRCLELATALGKFEAEGWRVRKDGSLFWASVVLTALRDEEGVLQGFVKITRDITERRKSQEEIHRLVSYQQAILDNIPVGIAITNQNNVLQQANKAFQQLYGHAEDTVESSHQETLLFSEQKENQEFLAHAHAACLKGETFSDDLQMRRKDGSKVWIRLTAHLIDKEQPDFGVIWAAEDISALKELNQTLERSNADLERFAYVASHDLRQPLRMVTGYLGLIERRLRPVMEQDTREFISFAIDGAKRMDMMIVELLNYSRLGKKGVAFSEVSLQDIAERALRNLSLSIADAQADVKISDPLPMVYGSAPELERLIQNLISNAIKFRAEGRAPIVTLSCQDMPESWILSVQDNGIGIPSDQHQRLFTIFSRLVTQDQYEGTGIGLASCRKIAEHHGGTISVQSEEGQGATFSVVLPKHHHDATATHEQDASSPP